MIASQTAAPQQGALCLFCWCLAALTSVELHNAHSSPGSRVEDGPGRVDSIAYMRLTTLARYALELLN